MNIDFSEGLGTFEWEGESFAWGPCSDPLWFGFFEVLDSQDFVLATAMNPELAVHGALEELEYLKQSVEDALHRLMGEEA